MRRCLRQSPVPVDQRRRNQPPHRTDLEGILQAKDSAGGGNNQIRHKPVDHCDQKRYARGAEDVAYLDYGQIIPLAVGQQPPVETGVYHALPCLGAHEQDGHGYRQSPRPLSPDIPDAHDKHGPIQPLRHAEQHVCRHRHQPDPVEIAQPVQKRHHIGYPHQPPETRLRPADKNKPNKTDPRENSPLKRNLYDGQHQRGRRKRPERQHDLA